MDSTLRADTLTSEALSAVSWASIAAGAVSAAALTWRSWLLERGLAFPQFPRGAIPAFQRPRSKLLPVSIWSS